MSAALPAEIPTSVQRLQSCMALADHRSGTAPAQALQAAAEAVGLAQELGDELGYALASSSLVVQLLRLGRYQQAVEVAPGALKTLHSFGPAGEAAAEFRDLTRYFVMSACEIGQFGPALEAANALMQACMATQDSEGLLIAANCLAMCSERMGDSWQALKIMKQAQQAYGESASGGSRLLGLLGLSATCVGLFHRLGGSEDTAVATVAAAAAVAAPTTELAAVLSEGATAAREALALSNQLSDSVGEVAACGNLGELLLYQGKVEEAALLLQRALVRAQAAGMVAYGWRVRATLGVCSLRQQQPAQARVQMLDLLKEMGEAAPRLTAIRVHHAAYSACKSLGLAQEALAHFEQVEKLERLRAVSQLRAQSEHFVSRAQAQVSEWQADQARQDATRQRALAQEEAAKAEQDALTTLGNRRLVLRRWPELVAAESQLNPSGADGHLLALALVDIDHFKQVNDRFGHAAGDQVLVELAALLRQSTRSTDVLARHGGEEFLILFAGLRLQEAEEICNRMRLRVAAHDWSHVLGPAHGLTISVGLAAAPPLELNALVQLADEALYRAKHAGRNLVVLRRPAG